MASEATDAEPINHRTDLTTRDKYLRELLYKWDPGWKGAIPQRPERATGAPTQLIYSNFHVDHHLHLHIEQWDERLRTRDMRWLPAFMNHYDLSRCMTRILRYGWMEFTARWNIHMGQGGWLKIEDVAWMCGHKMNCEVQPQHIVAVGVEASQKSRPTDKNRYQFAWMDDNWDDAEEKPAPRGDRNRAFPFVAVRAVQGHFVADVDDRREFRLLDNSEELASHLRPLIHGTLLPKVPAILKSGLIPAGGGVSASSPATHGCLHPEDKTTTANHRNSDLRRCRNVTGSIGGLHRRVRMW